MSTTRNLIDWNMSKIATESWPTLLAITEKNIFSYVVRGGRFRKMPGQNFKTIFCIDHTEAMVEAEVAEVARSYSKQIGR